MNPTAWHWFWTLWLAGGIANYFIADLLCFVIVRKQYPLRFRLNLSKIKYQIHNGVPTPGTSRPSVVSRVAFSWIGFAYKLAFTKAIELGNRLGIESDEAGCQKRLRGDDLSVEEVVANLVVANCGVYGAEKERVDLADAIKIHLTQSNVPYSSERIERHIQDYLASKTQVA